MFKRDTTPRTPAEYSWGRSSSYAVNAPPEFSRRSGWMNGIGIPAKTPGTTHHSRLLFCVVLKHVLLPLRVAPPAQKSNLLWWVVPGVLAGMPMPFIQPERRLNSGGALTAY